MQLQNIFNFIFLHFKSRPIKIIIKRTIRTLKKIFLLHYSTMNSKNIIAHIRLLIEENTLNYIASSQAELQSRANSFF